jgi:hypothetical protein
MDQRVPKRIYLTKRNPSLSPDQFRARWRAHGALGLSQPTWPPNISRYVHCDLLTNTGGIAGASDEYDGMACIWYNSHSAWRQRSLAPGDREAMLRDEDQTFAQRIGLVALMAHEHLMRDGPTGGIKQTSFLRRKPGRAQADFIAHRQADAARLLAHPETSALIRRYALNVPFPTETGSPWGLDYDCVEEIWFDSLHDLLACHGAAETVAASQASRAEWVQDWLTVLGRDVLVDDAEHPELVDAAISARRDVVQKQ